MPVNITVDLTNTFVQGGAMNRGLLFAGPHSIGPHLHPDIEQSWPELGELGTVQVLIKQPGIAANIPSVSQ